MNYMNSGITNELSASISAKSTQPWPVFPKGERIHRTRLGGTSGTRRFTLTDTHYFGKSNMSVLGGLSHLVSGLVDPGDFNGISGAMSTYN